MFHNPFHLTFNFGLILLLPVLLIPTNTSTALAQQDTQQSLPSGEEILKRHIQKTGGQNAYDAIKNRVTESTLELAGQGIKIEIKTFAARPNKTRVMLDSPATGKIERGCNGNVAWSNSVVDGPVVQEGAQHYTEMRDSTFERFASWKSIFESAECLGTKAVNGRECFEVRLDCKPAPTAEHTPRPMNVFFDRENYLIRKIETTLDTPMGKIDMEAFASDYREVDGIQFAHQLNLHLLGQQRIMRVTRIEQNVDLPKDIFDLPPEVRELIK